MPKRPFSSPSNEKRLRQPGEQSASENSDGAQQKNRQKTAERHQVIGILDLHRHISGERNEIITFRLLPTK
jgi:hypothetical protein